MAVFKCKMCGAALEISDVTITTCRFCGTQQTLPKLNDERRTNLYDRANHFRRNNEFDKAMGIYEQILNEDKTDAEAYWSLVLCRFGIEYVEDPASHKRMPTVNRAQFTSVFDDDNYKSALQYADGYQRNIYEEEAKAINDIQKGILAISQKEEPFDVFICYKETDNNGRRTPDSVLATELYHELIREGYKVFFARITLEDKLGSAYEPYIFAALNSAKVMVVLGTKPEHFNAVWVKNEWSRYLALIKNGARKMLIPAYRDMDPYDLPEEFSHLQAQDMSRLGFMQDLIRGIKKIVQVNGTMAVNDGMGFAGNANTAPLLKRAFMFLEDGDWNSADEYCEKVLDIEPENAQAYLGKLMAELRVKKQDDLKDCDDPFDHKNHFQKAVRFATEEQKAVLNGYIEHINTRNENARVEAIYRQAKCAMEGDGTEASYKAAAEAFQSILHYKDAEKLVDICLEKAEAARKDEILANGKARMVGRTIYCYESAIPVLESISGWKDADEQLAICKQKIEELKEKEEIARREQARQLEFDRQTAKRKNKIAMIAAAVVCAFLAVVVAVNGYIIPGIRYNKAQSEKLWEEIAQRETIAAGGYHTVGLNSDGTVVAVGYNGYGQRDVSDWTDIVAVSAGAWHTVGLKRDGTVVAVGNNSDGRCDVGDWTDIVAVSAGGGHTVGLKRDGTVVAVGGNSDGRCDVGDWTDIVAVSTGAYHTVGLKRDGTVVAVGYNGYGQCNVSDWTDIVAVSAGSYHTVGLKRDGTVVVVGFNGYGQRNVSDWTDIVAVSAGRYHTVGLKRDGTVVAAGDNTYGQRKVSGWTDIVAISAGRYHTVGLKRDGTVVAAGNNGDGQCDVGDWTDIKLPGKQ